MKKKSVLIKRAAILSATVLSVTVVVVLCLSLLLSSLSARSDAQARLLSATRALSESADQAYAGEADALEAAADALKGQYGRLDFAFALVGVTDDLSALPYSPGADAQKLVASAMLGRDTSARMTDNQGRARVYAAIPVWADGIVSGVLVTCALVPGLFVSVWPVAVALIVALMIAVPLIYVLLRKLVVPVVAPIRRLRDVAVKVAGGDFNAHADENVPGELGQLGLALNNLSSQLSRNMYALIVERNRLKQMIDGLSEGIIAVDAHGHVTHRNPAVDRMFTPAAPSVTLPDPRMRMIGDQTIWEDFDQVIADGKVITRNIESRDMVLRLIITPIVDEIGANAGAVGLVSDITQLERLERTRRDYVANVSHEMRTPLTAMRALIEPLKEGMVTKEEDRLRYYDIIMREVMRLSRLINDLMELSRLQSGTLAIQTSRMELEELVMDVCDRYSYIAEDHGLTFSVDTDFSACPPVITNPDRVEQMLVILLDNAIKYTQGGGHVSLSASWDDRRVVLSVSDTGIGISPEDLPYVFDRFYKVDKAHSGMGSGLGLSIARELLKWMGEEIWVTSEKGKGSTFSFTVKRDRNNA